MATDGPLPPSAAAAPIDVERSSLSGDWPSQAASAVVDLVGTVRDRTVGPIMMIARAIVYGIVILVLAATATVLLVVSLVRFVDWLVPGEVWSAYLVLGSLFTVVGLGMWSMRRPRRA